MAFESEKLQSTSFVAAFISTENIVNFQFYGEGSVLLQLLSDCMEATVCHKLAVALHMVNCSKSFCFRRYMRIGLRRRC